MAEPVNSENLKEHQLFFCPSVSVVVLVLKGELHRSHTSRSVYRSQGVPLHMQWKSCIKPFGAKEEAAQNPINC